MFKFHKNPMWRQYAVVIIVNLSNYCCGVGLAWTSPVIAKLSDEAQTVLPRPITLEEGSWIVSIGFLAAIPANLFIGTVLIDRLGRKPCLLLVCLPKLVAGFVFIYANEVWMLLLGRVLVGLSDAGVFVLPTIYASEIASTKIRGSLGTILQIMFTFGIVTMLSMGPFVSYNMLNIIFTGIVIFSMIPLLIIPDGPYSLYSRGHKAESLKVLTYLRGSETLANEEMKEYDQASETNNIRISKKEILTNKLFLKSMFLVSVLGCGTQLIGLNVVPFYLQTVLESTHTSVRPEDASVIIGWTQLFASFCTTLVSDRVGRKTILTVTFVGIGLGMLVLGLFFKLKEEESVDGYLNYLPLISLILVNDCFGAGMGSLIWIIIAELFDHHSRGLGMFVSMTLINVAIFLTTKYFAIISVAVGPAITYWIFGGNSVLFCLFVIFCLPETRGRTFAEIQDILRGKKEENDSKTSA